MSQHLLTRAPSSLWAEAPGSSPLMLAETYHGQTWWDSTSEMRKPRLAGCCPGSFWD